MTATFTLEIDWDMDGTFTDESVYFRRVVTDRGREHSITSYRYSHVLTGRMTIYLNNSNGRFTEYNTASPLYGYLLPFRDVKFKVSTGGGEDFVYTGKVSDIRPRRTREGDQYAIIECVDGFDYLRNMMCNPNLLQTDLAVSSAIVELLNQANWAYADTSGWQFSTQLGIDSYLGSTLIENNGDTMPFWWSDPGIDILGAIMQLCDTFAGDAYIANDGTFQYAARKLDGNPVLTITDDDITADSDLQRPWDDVRNKGRVRFFPYAAENSATIWKLVDPMEIAASQTKTIYAQYQYSDIVPSPASSVVTPVSTTDYTANTQADGGGTDKTAQLGVVMTAYATYAKLELTNNDASTIYVDFFQLRGVLITARNTTYVEDSDSTSIGNYGTRTLTIEENWTQEERIALNHAGYIKTVYGNPRSVLWLEFLNNDNKQFAVDLFDYIDCTISEWGIDGRFVVTSIKNDLNPQNRKTTWRCEPAVGETLSFWHFPATFETNTYLGW